MKVVFLLVGAGLTASLLAQPVVRLPELTVHSPRVANQAPAGSFAMPVSALRFEPRVDLHGRNLAEGQADITVRGGIFENTGFQVGALTLSDAQTGHYLAELPVAPAMLTAPEVVTGAGLTLGASNATTGALRQGWRPIRNAGMLAVGAGDYELRRGELYQGVVTTPRSGGRRFGADIALARSESDGSVAFGEHEFDRATLRLQTATATAQTDVVAGYQGKRFGWPNLYTPFNSNETENLQTSLFAVNHRQDLGEGGFVEAGAFHRRNKDDYAFNRFAPLGPVHPFQHTTWMTGGAIGGRVVRGDVAVGFRAEAVADELTSTSLTFGRYRTRTVTKVAVVPEKTWRDASGGQTTVRAGVARDDSNREAGAFAPMFELERTLPSAALRKISLGYTKTTQLATYTALNSSATAGLFRGNPNLGRQRAHTIELGVAGTLMGWATESTVFWRRDDALVDWTFRRGVTARTANAVDMDVVGFEWVGRRSWTAADVVVGYTALTKDADYRGAAVDGSFYAGNYARHRLTVAVTWRLGAGFELRVDNVARLQEDNLLRTRGGDEAVQTSAGLAYRRPEWAGIEVGLYVDNLWDSAYQDVPAVPAAGRQVSAGVTYTW